jgi:hypothetical protein
MIKILAILYSYHNQLYIKFVSRFNLSQLDQQELIKTTVSWIKTNKIILISDYNGFCFNYSPMMEREHKEGANVTKEIGLNNTSLDCPNLKTIMRRNDLDQLSKFYQVHNDSIPLKEESLIVNLSLVDEVFVESIGYKINKQTFDFIKEEPKTIPKDITSEEQSIILSNLIKDEKSSEGKYYESIGITHGMNQLNASVIWPFTQINTTIGKGMIKTKKPKHKKQQQPEINFFKQHSFKGKPKSDSIKLESQNGIQIQDSVKYFQNLQIKFKIKSLKKPRPDLQKKNINLKKYNTLMSSDTLSTFSVSFLKEFFYVTIIDSCVLRILSFT